jgi:HlyD family secretion protein
VASGADGIVTDFLVDQGQYVKQGDPLCQLRTRSTDLGIAEAKAVLAERAHQLEELERGSRTEDIAEAKAKLLAAEALMKITGNRLKRVNSLFGQKAVNQDEFEDATQRAEAARQAQNALKAAHERVTAGERPEVIAQARTRFEAQRERVAFLEAEKEKRRTLAPFGGYVVQVQTFVGQWLSKGDPIIVFSMLDEVDVVVNVDQSDLKHVQLGQNVKVRIPGTEPPVWEGLVVSIVPRSDWEEGSRSFPVEVRLKNRFYEAENEKRPVLKEGMMCEATFNGAPVDVVLVPKDALVRTSRGINIYTLTPSPDDAATGTTAQVPVKLGMSEGSFIQVLPQQPQDSASNPTIDANTLVVTEGAERLQPFPQEVRLAQTTPPAHAEDEGESPEKSETESSDQ